jgi:hypothetical protein
VTEPPRVAVLTSETAPQLITTTLPPLHPDVIAACQAAGWQAVTYQGITVTPGGSQRHAGIVAVHDGALRAHIEWQAPPGASEWRTRFAEMAIRCPDHAPGDFARVYPARWRKQPGCRGLHCRLSGTWPLLRLLALPPGVIAEAVTGQAAAS